MRHLETAATPGGRRLRLLRETAGRTQFDVELDASLGIGYLQRLELGKVRRPERETLERILAALGAGFAERGEVLGLFGYTIPFAIPDEAEVGWAVDAFQAESRETPFPAYLLDCVHRLLAWNSLVPELYGVVRQDLAASPIPRLFFDPSYGIAPLVINAESFFAAQIRVLLYERQRCGDDDWYAGFIDEMRHVSAFDHYWLQQSADIPVIQPMRPRALLHLATSRGAARFRLIAEVFSQDPRFRVIHYLPADPATAHLCLSW